MFWDTLVAICIVGPALASMWFMQKDGVWTMFAAILLWIGIGLTIYGSFIEPRLIRLNKKIIHISALPKIRIAVVADIHVGPYKRTGYVQRIVKKVMSLHADIIVLPGDFIFDHHSDVSYLKPLKELNAPLGVYAILGNHDAGLHLTGGLLKEGTPYRTQDRTDDVVEILKSAGITMLRNTSVTHEIDGVRFSLAGVDDIWMESSDARSTLEAIHGKTPVILLAHNPDIILQEEHALADLIISGHTHGGQVRMPFVGPVFGLPDKIGKAFDQGIFTLKNGTVLAITHGIGETMGRMRLFCPPEILMLQNQP